jgi:hypothetical protein
MSPMKLDVLFSPSTPLHSRPRTCCSRASASLAITLSRTRGGLAARALGHEQASFGRKLGNPVVCEPLDLL